MQLSSYKELLTSIYEVEQEVKKFLNKEGVLYDLVKVVEYHESFLVIKLVYKGRESWTSINLWSIIDDKKCKWC